MKPRITTDVNRGRMYAGVDQEAIRKALRVSP